jgi:predicted amidohydrolase
MTTIRIALANLRAAPTRDESVTRARDAIRRAGDAGALVVCFPECYVPGYRVASRPLPPPDVVFLESAWAMIAQAAKEACVAVILGTERIVDGAARLTAVVFDRDGTMLGVQDKVQLDPSEENSYVPGAGRRTFEVGALTFGVVICHEGWRYPETVRAAARLGAQVVFHPHFHDAEPSGFRPTRFADPRNTFHEKAMLCRAAENTCYFASVNCAADGSPTTSAVVGPDGVVRAWQRYGEEGLLLADVELGEATGLLARRLRPSPTDAAGDGKLSASF